MTALEQLEQAEEWLDRQERMLAEMREMENAEACCAVLEEVIESLRHYIEEIEPYAAREQAEEEAWMNREYERMVF